MSEQHYVIAPNPKSLEVWAYENITGEWHVRGVGYIVTPTATYRAVMSIRHMRGAVMTPETLHYIEGWSTGLTPEQIAEMEAYIEVCLAAGAAQ